MVNDTNHPDLLALETLRTGEGSETDRSHVDRCDACRDEMARLDRLARRIEGLAPPAPAVPAHVDRAILAMARRKKNIFTMRMPLAAAASILVCIAAVFLLSQTGRRHSQSVARADVDRNGAVDIADAYILARKLHRAEPVSMEWDLNADGQVDGRDVDAVIRMSTALSGKAYTIDSRLPKDNVRFVTLDVVIDLGPLGLAAYQFELVCDAKKSRIVGIEGGEKAPFMGAPHYDPAALTAGRIVVAAFTLGETMPSGKVRVARIHMQETDGENPSYAVRMMAAAAPGGERIDVKTELIRKGDK